MASVASAGSRRGQRVTGGYRCPEPGCEATFDLSGDLRHHQRKHQAKEERPHACRLCDQRFTYPKDLRRHHTARHHNVQFSVDETCRTAKRSRSKSPPAQERPKLKKGKFHDDLLLLNSNPWDRIEKHYVDGGVPRQADKLKRLKLFARHLNPVISDHKSAVAVAKRWLQAIGSLINFGSRVEGGPARDTAEAIEHLMTELDLVEARHDFENLGAFSSGSSL